VTDRHPATSIIKCRAKGGGEPIGVPASAGSDGTMTHYVALQSIVFMIGFVWLFDRQHQHHRLHRLFATAALMTPQELEWIRRIQSACEDA
jgi:hypothetical protein